MLFTLANTIFIAVTVGLGAFVVGRAGRHRPALWLLAYTCDLALFTLVLLITPYTKSG